MMPVESLTPGMELRSDVHDQSGRLLAKAETVLNEKHIKVLKTWGVTHAEIKDGNEISEPQAPAKPPSAASIAQAEEIADYLFGHANREHPAMQQLYNICVQRMAAKFSVSGE